MLNLESRSSVPIPKFAQTLANFSIITPLARPITAARYQAKIANTAGAALQGVPFHSSHDHRSICLLWRDEVIPSRGEIAAACAIIGQKPVIGGQPCRYRHTARRLSSALALPAGRASAPPMSSAFLMTMA